MDKKTRKELETLQKEVRRAAEDVASSWLHTVEADDIEQEVMVDLLEAPGSLDKLLKEAPKTRRNFLKNMATRVAAKQQDEYEYFSGNYTYDTTQVRKLLKSGVLDEDPIDFDAARADLQEAMYSLWDAGSPYAETITDAYSADGEMPHWTSAERQRLDKAVAALTNRMNRIGAERKRRWVEGPGSRKVMSNFEAQHETGEV